MKNALWKDIFRDIGKSRGRFISILSIIALGVMLFTGVKMAPVDMKATADKYYDDYNLMDLRIVSTLGLTDKDITDIKNVQGVLGVYGSKTIDALMKTEANEYVIRVHSIAEDYSENNDEYINRVKLVEGRMPETENECVIGNSKKEALDLKIGDKITLKSGNDKEINKSLNNDEYVIVGTVDTPYYLSNQIGSSNIGSGTVNEYIYIKDSAFNMDTYTDIFVTVKDVKGLNSYKNKYFDKVKEVKNSIELISDKANERRYNEIIEPIQEQINKGNDEINKIKELYGGNEQLYGNVVSEIEDNLQKAKESISEVEKPKWILLDRKSHYSYADYESGADSINKLSNVFPVFFIVVAALVCLTTMTRMVDEQRINIGTLKALGYSQWHIAKKFIIYALFASLVGCIVGLSIGFTFLPKVIYDAYNIIYVLPKIQFTVDILFALAVILVTVGLTTIVTYIACRIELIETPSILMRPKAPKEGKRILLERIPFIWNKFNFTGKVTVRNIFRYKKRFLMTVIGIAGSTALLLAGFGIKDSITAVVDKQFGEIDKYQLSITLNSHISENDKTNLEGKIKNENDIKDYLFISKTNITASANNENQMVSLIVPSDNKRLNNFIHLENRKSKENINIPSDGVVISEKLAKLLGVTVGDSIEIENDNNEKKEVVISKVSENYINHYIYMDIDYYESIFEEPVDFNEILVKMINDNSNLAEKTSARLIVENGVSGITDNTGVKDSFGDTIKSLDFVVVVMVLCAGALSFVVLYNLTNVNISERIREIATIKVLGFYDKEVSSYIFRENILLTVIGLICGLGLGVIFHRFIIGTVEMDFVMFGRGIKILSFIFAALLTVVFAFLVNWAMYYKLKNVQMVESLKSVD